MSYSVVIIGSGNMAFHLSGAFSKAEVPVKQIYNRSNRGLAQIASMTRIPTTFDFHQLDTSADIYIIAVKDDAIPIMANKLAGKLNERAIVVHTSGSGSINLFSRLFQHYGSFYPLQSLKKERPVNFKNVPIFISSNSDYVSSALSELGRSISDQIIEIPDNKRSKLHVTAVIVNNFVNHLYALTDDICQEEGLQFKHLIPLMQETHDRLKDGNDPKKMQTGPALRRDKKTLSSHRVFLRDHPSILRLYNYLTRHIQDYHEDR